VHFEFPVAARTVKNHVADFEIVFDEDPLSGLKLVGGALWGSRDGGEIRVTLPAQKIVHDGKERYFDLLRSISRDAQAIKDFKARVVSAYHAKRG
jgi:hypothetical protein